jgi:septal ring factor EnvC (AmiA/AmiB activator)
MLLACLCSCRSKPAVDPAELARLRVEQKELRARIEVLQAKVAALTDAPRNPSPNAPLSPDAPAPANAAAPAPLPTTQPRSPAASAATGSALRTEDLHGSPVASGLLPQAQDDAPSEEQKQMLEQLRGQMEQVKQNQAQQQSALDELEKIK